MVDRLRVLSLNSGSSSLKFSLHDLGDGDTRVARGVVEGIGLPSGRLRMREGDAPERVASADRYVDGASALDAVLAAVRDLGGGRPDAVGHRLVRGGPDYEAPERIDAPLLAALRALIPFAPLHLPSEIRGIEAVASRFPGIPQVACFDTAFHRRMPELAQRFPLLRPLWDAGVRRYGFHGLSYEYVVGELGAAINGRTIIAHLGNGASMVAVRDGVPLDTTMGFTPTGGFMMGTRSGDLDPGVLLYLLREQGYDADALERLVTRDAGWFGVSALSSDMRTLLDQRERDPRAAQAIEMFCYHARKQVGALATVLGGLDHLVFTGGIGEHAAPIRWDLCHGLDHLGVRLDPARNDANAPVISADGSRCAVRVVRTDEELMIARHTHRLLVAGST